MDKLDLSVENTSQDDIALTYIIKYKQDLRQS